MPPLRSVAAAFVAGTVLVLALDSLLHLALAAVRVSDVAAPWWVNARVAERSAWVVMALLLRAFAPSRRAGGHAAAFRLTGTLFIAVPIAWAVATTLVTIARILFTGAWDTGFRLFLEPYFYSNLVLTNAPWVLAGAVLVVMSRHLGESDGHEDTKNTKDTKNPF